MCIKWLGHSIKTGPYISLFLTLSIDFQPTKADILKLIEIISLMYLVDHNDISDHIYCMESGNI